MNLKDKLKTIKPRENSGSISSNRFDFQKNWAICKLIELTHSNIDFLLAFEYHEDIIIFDASDSPNKIDFFQIKTKNKGAYTLNEILKKSKTKTSEGDSILGKLFQNKLNFDQETNSLNIISNTTLNISDKKNNAVICCNELTNEEKSSIKKSLESELGISWVDDFLDFIFFHTSELTIQHHNEITKDKLNRLIENIYSTDVKYNPSLAYRTIFDEVNRRNNIEKGIENFDELIQYKSISKNDFQKMLQIVVSEPNKLETLKNKIFNSLDSAGIVVSERKQLLSAWKDLEIEFLSVNNDFFKKCVDVVKKSINKNIDSLNVNILECLKIIYNDIITYKLIREQKIYSEHFLKTLILKEIYDEE